jgi:hypothetical protein
MGAARVYRCGHALKRLAQEWALTVNLLAPALKSNKWKIVFHPDRSVLGNTLTKLLAVFYHSPPGLKKDDLSSSFYKHGGIATTHLTETTTTRETSFESERNVICVS